MVHVGGDGSQEGCGAAFVPVLGTCTQVRCHVDEVYGCQLEKVATNQVVLLCAGVRHPLTLKHTMEAHSQEKTDGDPL